MENKGGSRAIPEVFDNSSILPGWELPSASSTDLTMKVMGDIAIGTSVTFGVAPFLTVVDKAIVQSTAGSHTLIQSGIESVKGIISQPKNYLKSPTFLLMWGVYAATYSSANSLKTIVEHQEGRSNNQPKSSTRHANPGKFGVFLGTTMVNSGTSLMKDQAYAKMFGMNSTTLAVPRLSYAFWMMRDLSVIGSSFILPDLVSGHVSTAFGIDQESARSMSQICLPIIAQTIAGPLHFLGLDLYNRNLHSKSWRTAIANRARYLRKGYTSVVAARIARIAPGYGIGGVMNTKLRDKWRSYLVTSSTTPLR